jgi:hypothetical protein
MNCLDIQDKTPLAGDIGDFSEPVPFLKVDGTPRESLWEQLVRDDHDLGLDSVIGGRVKYLITIGTRLIGAVSFCSAAHKPGARDQFVGLDEKTRLECLPYLLNNNRFLILPWIHVQNLASHVLSMSLKRVRVDWEKQYYVEPYMVESFVDRSRFNGTSYISANWTYLGVTKGYGRVGKSFVFHGHEKDLFVYVMNRRLK